MDRTFTELVRKSLEEEHEISLVFAGTLLYGVIRGRQVAISYVRAARKYRVVVDETRAGDTDLPPAGPLPRDMAGQIARKLAERINQATEV